MRAARIKTPGRSCSSLPVHRYFISLGSNLGDREASLRKGWSLLSPFCSFQRLSRIYETRPLYVAEQPRYLNAVGEARSTLDPRGMLLELNRIETAMGRDRSREIRRGPRTLDLDILLCDHLVLDEPDLVIPHPGMPERLFVLIPLLELAPESTDPRTGTSYASAAASLAAETADGGVYLYTRAGYTDSPNSEY